MLPREAEGVRPVHLERLFDCLEYTLRSCPEGCKKRLALGAMILHMNDDHHWSRERIAQWVAPPPETKAEEKPPAVPDRLAGPPSAASTSRRLTLGLILHDRPPGRAFTRPRACSPSGTCRRRARR